MNKNRILRTFRQGLLTAALLALATGAQAANLVVNGLYELTGTTAESYTGIYVGETTPSTLNIKDSAALTSSGTFFIGDNADGTVNLSGGTLAYTGNNFWIGWNRSGVMNISGGTANFNTTVIVYDHELNLSGGTLNVANYETRVGWDGGSLLAISGGTNNLYSINMNHPASRFLLTGGTLNLGAGGLYGNTSSTINFTGGTLKLSNNGAIAVDFGTAGTVDALFFDGVPQATGTWGRTGSGATHINDTYFTGSGMLIVGASSTPYQTWAGSEPFNSDLNGDGVANGLAWILGVGAGGPAANACPFLPTAGRITDYMTLRFKRVHDVGPAHLILEYSNDLNAVDPWHSVDVTVGGMHGDIEVDVIPGDPNDAVTVKIPTSHASAAGSLFARLLATENPPL